MLVRLSQVAARLGYQSLVAEVLTDNAVMMHLLREVFPTATITRSSGVAHVRCPTWDAELTIPAQRAPALAGV